MKPYLIAAHDYKRTSAGVRALHYLAHSINGAGGEAYVVADVVNPEWNTPRASEEIIAQVASEGIVIYPEVDEGNQFEASRIARIVLNVPGHIRGTGELAPFGACFHYVPILAPYVPDGSELLTIPVIELGTFKPNSLERNRAVFWRGKGQQFYKIPDVWDHRGMTEITEQWPAERAVLAALFQVSELFYSYTDYTMLTNEARLCGCPAVVIPSGHFSRMAFMECPGGMAGLAWGPSYSNIIGAMGTISGFAYRYRRDMEQWPGQFARFLGITQAIK